MVPIPQERHCVETDEDAVILLTVAAGLSAAPTLWAESALVLRQTLPWAGPPSSQPSKQGPSNV